MKKVGSETKDSKVLTLAQRLAGDKWEKVQEETRDLRQHEGKSPNRALADALETFKCPNTP